MSYLRDLVYQARNFFRNSQLRMFSIYGFSSGISQLGTVLYAFLVARILGPEDYGLLSAHYAVSALTIFSVNLGMDTWLLYAGATDLNPRKITGFVIQTKLVLGVVWLFILIGLAPTIKSSLYFHGLIAITAIDILGDSLLVSFLSGMNVIDATKHASFVLILTRIGRLITAFFLYLRESISIEDFAFSRLLVTLTGLSLALLFLRPKFEFHFCVHLSKRFKEFIKYGIPEALSIIYTQADITILGLMLNQVSIGFYSPAVSLINSFFVVYSAFFLILVPKMTKSLQSQVTLLRQTIRRIFLFYSSIGMTCAIAISLLIRPIIRLGLGDAYSITALLIQIMAPILFLKSVSFACVTILIASGTPTKRIVPQALSASLNFAMNIILIPRFGVFGAAISYIVSETVLLTGYFYITIRQVQKLNSNHLPTITTS